MAPATHSTFALLRPRRRMMPPPAAPQPSKADLLADGWTFHGVGSSSATDGAADKKQTPGALMLEGAHGDLAQEVCASGMLALPNVLAVMEASRTNAAIQLQGCRGMSMLAEREETRQQLIAKVERSIAWHSTCACACACMVCTPLRWRLATCMHGTECACVHAHVWHAHLSGRHRGGGGGDGGAPYSDGGAGVRLLGTR